MPEELQKDPLSRGQFLWMGVVGTFMGAVLTLPPAVYFLSPSIKTVLLGRSDVPDEWKEVGSVFEIPAGEAAVRLVEFTQLQTYEAGQPGAEKGDITNAVLVSWKDGEPPSVLVNRDRASTLTEAEIEELSGKLNVMSNACAHMGCPVRWSEEDKELLCPCHGGVYDINGKHTGGPPPHGLWRYVFEVREDGGIYVKHEFYVDEKKGGRPYVV